MATPIPTRMVPPATTKRGQLREIEVREEEEPRAIGEAGMDAQLWNTRKP
jgi:hypothetical protein